MSDTCMANCLREGNAQSLDSRRINKMLYRFNNLLVLDKRDIQRVELFVENRVQEIRRLIEPGYWSHCKGEENPADIPTCRSNVSKLERNLMWWNGPSWVMSTQLVPLASENSAELADMPFRVSTDPRFVSHSILPIYVFRSGSVQVCLTVQASIHCIVEIC